METKTWELGVKQASEGKVVATLARLSVRDRDGDILLPNLLYGEKLVSIKPQHRWEHVDLGVAEVYEKEGTLEAAMEFNFAIPSARDWFESIKFAHARNKRTQYSFGFEVLDYTHGEHDGKPARYLKSIAMAEVSPVLLGASVGSQTLDIKSLSAAHSRGGPRIMHPKTYFLDAGTSFRKARQHVLYVERKLSEPASDVNRRRMLDDIKDALDYIDGGQEHCDKGLDALDTLALASPAAPPAVEPVTTPKTITPEPVVPAALTAAEPPDEEEPPMGEKGGKRPIAEQFDEVMREAEDLAVRLEEVKRLRGTPDERYPNGRPMSAERLSQVDTLMTRLSRLKETSAQAAEADATQQDLQDMAERFKKLGVKL